MLDCRLNDPNVSVELYRKLAMDSVQRFTKVDPQTDQFVKQNGQNFTITLHGHGKMVDFRCKATEEGGQPVLEPKDVTLQRARGLKQH